jgi:hypothetical protein
VNGGHGGWQGTRATERIPGLQRDDWSTITNQCLAIYCLASYYLTAGKGRRRLAGYISSRCPKPIDYVVYLDGPSTEAVEQVQEPSQQDALCRHVQRQRLWERGQGHQRNALVAHATKDRQAVPR